MAEPRLPSAVDALVGALTGVARHMLIGGVAVIARGVRRLTDDVDATIWARELDVEALQRRLKKHGISPRIRDAAAFARRNHVLLLRHDASGTNIDLSFALLAFENEALERASPLTVGRRRVRVASAEDLVVYKSVAARERDLSDIERLLEIHGDAIDLSRVRRTVEELAGLLERPELVAGLERIIRAVRQRRGAPAKRRARPKRPRKRKKAAARKR